MGWNIYEGAFLIFYAPFFSFMAPSSCDNSKNLEKLSHENAAVRKYKCSFRKYFKPLHATMLSSTVFEQITITIFLFFFLYTVFPRIVVATTILFLKF